ncbi:hypothetical protein BATDEDRAFT_23127 [Batrachochytrium dendrobatidis JAM81]|uniref:Uncharacterized protein n=1 Tax=Batrachochytrium dendrobatidis (strain JAM81 / FGSC 10211) TaxID=684364 RepID=F4NWT4_BATDJ|nr:uncharacterized protein BATDEDRAFT_23127 [Batrachochytrium dendrobatidis JAM81]EGF82543.1 hypothetical protein BATDEDRAFT_23127 [Batrachochytrium dendrobatidis JAM81]|eukprot:XP_006676710.1 hypothetical protein BATDEDRAFT_23127 [Batrachochytrium dendrobatidis JAM81]
MLLILLSLIALTTAFTLEPHHLQQLPPWQPLSNNSAHTILVSKEWQSLDPELISLTSKLNIDIHHSHGVAILKIVPHINNIAVHGADRILTLDYNQNKWMRGVVHGGSLASNHLFLHEESSLLDHLVYTDYHAAKLPRSTADTLEIPFVTPFHSIVSQKLADTNPVCIKPLHSTNLPIGFTLTAHNALRISRKNNAHQSVHAHNDLPHLDLIAKPLYLSSPGSKLRPVWRIADPTHLSSNRHIQFIDAQSGSIVATIPKVHHAHKGYVFSEIGMPQFGSRPPLTALENVFDPNIVRNSIFGNNGGHGIVGRDVRSSNACFAYTCTNGAVNGSCNESQSICIDFSSYSKDMVLGKDYFIATSYFSTEGAFIDLDRDWVADGYINGTIYMAWYNAPVFASKLVAPVFVDQNGDYIWGSDINFASLTGRERTDSFSELQAYHFLSTHAEFMRNLINDTSLCLIGTGANCAFQDPLNNRTATAFDSPMRFVTNLQSLKTWPDAGSPYPNIFAQLKQGLGKSLDNPIVFYEHSDYGDAYFSSFGFQPPTNGTEWRDCSFGKCVSIQDSYLDYIAFGQTSVSDWALDDCIAFHELTHAFVHKYIPDLPWVVWTSSGLKTDPGAMNEAWADYFSAIHCGISNFKKSYTHHPIRDLDNSLTCADTVGEVHFDGMIFSGALWEVRQAIKTIPTLVDSDYGLYDRIVLHAMMHGHTTDLFETQLNSILMMIQQHPRLNVLEDIATKVFTHRVFDCTRVSPMTEQSTTAFFLPTALTTEANISTLPTQLMFNPRPGDWGLFMSWDQWYESPILGPLTIGYGRTCIKALVSFECPIFLNGSDVSSIVPYSSCGSNSANTTLSWTCSEYDVTTFTGSLYIPFPFGHTPSTVYVWYAHQVPATMVMYSSKITFYGFNRIWRIVFLSVATAGVLSFLLMITIIFITWLVLLICSIFSSRTDTASPSSAEHTDQNNAETNRCCRCGPRALGILYMGTSAFFQCGVLVLTSIALVFGVYRDSFTYGTIGIFVIVGLVDMFAGLMIDQSHLAQHALQGSYLSKYADKIPTLPAAILRKSQRLTALPPLQQILTSVGLMFVVVTLCVFPIMVAQSTPIAVHVIGLIVFCILAIARFGCCLLFTIGLWRSGVNRLNT